METISKNRTIFMGIAIIWIMIYHIPALASLFPQPLFFLIKTGYAGVDIFLFLSSYGLYYSLKKDPSITRFYKKRFIRIFPTYFFAIIFFGLCNQLEITEILKSLLLVGFYIPTLRWNSFDWYIPALIILYIIFPLIYKHIKGICKYFIFIFITNILLTFYISDFLIKNELNTSIILFLTRIPIFILGAIYAHYENDINKKIPTKTNIFLLIIGIVLLYNINYFNDDNIKRYGLLFYPLILIVPSFLTIINKIPFQKYILLCSKLSFCGKYSLELYLIHWNLYNLRTYLNTNDRTIISIYLILCFFISFPLARYLNIIVNKIISHIEKNRYKYYN